MPLKYQAEIDAYNASFNDYSEVENKIAFRWTFEQITHPNNFLPVTKTNPSNKKAFEHVTGWALSFFETQQQSKARLQYISEDKPKAYKKLGTHIAEGKLQKTDGICQIQCDQFGHFNFFDYENVDFTPNFQIKEQVGVIG
ncbi:MAG: hypothetical protein WDN26_07150 [Chitinophagaceae bacterium]